MTPRGRACLLATGVTATWPLVGATALLRMVYPNVWYEMTVVVPAAAVSIGTVAWVTWRHHETLASYPVFWLLYSFFLAFPLCGLWIALAAFGDGDRPLDALGAGLGIQFFAAPFVGTLATVAGLDVAATIATVERVVKDASPTARVFVVAAALVLHLVIGVALASASFFPGGSTASYFGGASRS